MIISDKNACLTGIILAGGKGVRIGCSKHFLKIGGRNLIDWAADCLSPFVSSILVVTSEEQYHALKSGLPGAQVVSDLFPGKGPLGGIYTGLSHCRSSYGFVVGCDMPFINSALAGYMVENMHHYDAVVPQLNGMLEPLHAIYSKSCLAFIASMLVKDRLNITPLFGLVKTRYVTDDEIDVFDPQRLSFTNINTRHDLLKAGILLSGSAGIKAGSA